MKKVNKKFGTLHVLRDLDLEIEAGQKVTIIGPSGSGKSTVLRILMTLEHPTTGSVLIDGEPLFGQDGEGHSIPLPTPELRRVRGRISMVFQHFNLFPHLTVLQNVTLGPIQVRGVATAAAEERGRELLDMVGLGGKTEAWPAQLSGGQKQRVGIARALAMEPDIMLFDEVTSALDPELVGEVLNVLRRLAHETDMTMLFVTHEMGFAREISDTIVFFDKGNVLEQAAPEALFTEPREERTRQFLEAVLSH